MTCRHCSKIITNKGSLAAHEQVCSENPNRLSRDRSPLCGVQKGTPSPFKGKKRGRLSHWDDKFPLEDVMIEHSTYARTCLRRRILSLNLIEYKCAICGTGPVWMNKTMPLVLDHINGVNNDNRLENLRFVCSNCDTQLPTYKSRNRK